MTRTAVLLAAALLALAPTGRQLAASPADPFEFFAPTVQLTQKERARLAAGEVVTKTLPAVGRELAIFAAGPTNASADAVFGSVRDIVDLKKSPLVPEIGRFSTPPKIEDVAALTLDSPDLDAIKRCRAANCDLKLTPAEIAVLQQTIASTGPNWAAAVQQEFRRILVGRVTAYTTQGEKASPAIEGDADPREAFAALLQHSPFLEMRSPQLVGYLQRYPENHPSFDSFLYWSKERLTRKPLISVTHVTVARGETPDGPEAITVSREIFSTRYTSGGLALTALLRGNSPAGPRYLAYINRTWVDDIRSFWRPLIEWRVRSQASKVFSTARDRMEDWQK